MSMSNAVNKIPDFFSASSACRLRGRLDDVESRLLLK